MTGCPYCSIDPAGSPAARSRLRLDANWRLQHARPTSVPGWLLLVVRRHVAGLHELHDDEAAGLARWLVPTCRALHQVTGCEVEYLAQVADGATGSHLHLHIVARGRHWPRPKTGMSVLREIGDAGNRPLSDRAVAVFMQRMAVALDPARS